MFNKIVLLVLLMVAGFVLVAQQNKEELQRKQNDLKREIEELNRSLKQIRNSKSKSLANYNLVKRKIAAREELINTINKDMRLLDDNIYLSQLEINKLNRELDTLKQEYAKSLVFAYKNRSNYDYLNFIFSAATFNDAIKRVTYLKSYRQYREQQVANINKTQSIVENKIASLNNSKNQKAVALQDHSKQLQVLEEDRKEQNQVVTKLQSEEKNLSAAIRKRENDRRQIQSAITAAIRREQQLEAKRRADALAKQKAEEERLRKEALARNAANNNNTPSAPTSSSRRTEPATTGVTTAPKTERVYTPLESTEEGKAMSINFETNRGRLPWPVDAGHVSIPFGEYTIAGTKLRGRSDGITISLPTGSTVKAVADGEVISVIDIGGEQAVLVKHGKYLTTYSHLGSASVSRGQAVKPGTVLGRAAANDDGEGEVVFMVTTERGQHMNPESWLRRR
ncbi:murein hydrolase activator EnvC family protein [Aridibaculum aurantiacum]|uniref:murein hydrolase activator EnvC family protein n=1 Tax=Aridibaculum aurantiacum TaxID=2810307 RepID=UPI001A95C5C7|nr:peptidoglycan DD-metalloendopeptidase family protein [Aridibaculum aurantiacum]